MNPEEKKAIVVKEIAESIAHHRYIETNELKRNDKNLAVALSNVHYYGEDLKIWLTTNKNRGGSVVRRDITGSAVNTEVIGKTTITSDGKVVYRNGKFGEMLIRNSSGTHEVQTPTGQRKIKISNFSSFIPNPHTEEAIDLTIKIGKKPVTTFRSLNELLKSFKDKVKFINELDEEILKKEIEKRALEEQERIDDKELDRLIEEEERENAATLKREAEKREIDKKLTQLEKEKRERKDALIEAQSFIRQSAELRYQPILDRWQEEIKRLNIFDNTTLAIDGGPGTGKTTVLIQRIKFLTDEQALLGSQVDENELSSEGYMPNMTKVQREKLFENENNWVFFTPNALLRLFLKENMTKEGLKATNQRVMIWSDHLNNLVKRYNIVNPETRSPFLIYRNHKELSLLPTDSKKLKMIIKGFESFLLQHINDNLQKISQIDVSNFSWNQKGLSIQNFINKQEKEYTLEGLVRLYFNIQENYNEEIKQFAAQYNSLINEAAAQVLTEIDKCETTKQNVYRFAEQWLEDSRISDEEKNDDDDELEESKTDIEHYIFGKIKILIKNSALLKHDNTVKLTKKYKELNAILFSVCDIEVFNTFNQIGELAYFNKYFSRTTRGVVANIVSLIPKTYKAFRKKELEERKNKWNYELLESIIETRIEKNKRLHHNEQAFLVYFINTFIAKCYNVSKLKTKKISHPYFEAFRELSIPVIGVDEATDFHIIDLLAIHSLSDLDISSVSYSGDIMQRLTYTGIKSWKDLAPFIKSFNERKLYVSYRQSPTLLEVANTIYAKATKKEAVYSSYMPKDAKEPKPLFYQSNDEMEKVEWISKRILEIYTSYGRLIPSIAIFLHDSDDVKQFARELGNIDELADVGIQVKAGDNGEVLGDKNTVRVFSIKHIKGMEFEAAFFHNIHELADAFKSEEMLLKNIYVGLSRATFYLAITGNKESNSTRFLEQIFETNELHW